MGRKIRGKKHRGVKDPYQQQINKHSLVKDKINCAPTNIDEQPIPESVQNIIEWKKLAQETKSRKKKIKSTLVDSRLFEDQEETLRGMTRVERPIPAFIQHTGESNRKFLRRVDLICEEVVQESKTRGSSKDGFHAEDGMDEGMKKSKKERGNIEEIMSAGSNKKKKKLGVKKGEELRLSKKERVKLLLAGKKQAKLAKVQEKLEDSNRFRDHVAFGDIAHAPPNLKIPKRNQAKTPVESKPGRRGLLLQQMLRHDNQSLPSVGGTRSNKTKSVSSVDRERREKNRLIAVEAYRKLKLQKSLHKT